MLAYPFFYFLRRAFPTARIRVVCVPWVSSIQFLDLVNEAAVRSAWSDLKRRLGPRAIVARMVPRGVELALGMVREIQRTGDIFFPTRWTEATLGGHNSSEVAGIVEDFLARELQYPQRLRWTILTAADELFRITRR